MFFDLDKNISLPHFYEIPCELWIREVFFLLFSESHSDPRPTFD